MTRSSEALSVECLTQYLGRFPDNGIQSAHMIERMRAEATLESIMIITFEMTKHIWERNIPAESIFNVEDTAFKDRSTNKRVMAVIGLGMYGQS
jgi:uncharacterized protein YraI